MQSSPFRVLNWNIRPENPLPGETLPKTEGGGLEDRATRVRQKGEVGNNIQKLFGFFGRHRGCNVLFDWKVGHEE